MFAFSDKLEVKFDSDKKKIVCIQLGYEKNSFRNLIRINIRIIMILDQLNTSFYFHLLRKRKEVKNWKWRQARPKRQKLPVL